MELHIPHISFEMPITDLVMELEKLRHKEFSDSTNPLVFNQIRSIFHTLESVGSSRIEGNNTTIMDYVESTKIAPEATTPKEQILEIQNIEKAMGYIEDNIYDMPVSNKMIRELHQIAVDNLSVQKEGAQHPGAFRMHNVRIGGSSHTPPDFTDVPRYMQELMDFVNRNDAPKYDLLKIAIAHHRFVWIHPFENGNGRVVRLFTYALLLKFVFKSRKRIINPTAVFCSDRDRYYHFLSLADRGDDEGLLAWAQYMLEGLKTELDKIDRLSNPVVLREELLTPALDDALARKLISNEFYDILKTAISKKDYIIQSGDLSDVLPNKTSSDRSRLIKSLVQQRVLMPVYEGARKYYPVFSNNFLLRSMLKILDREGFLPINSGMEKVEETLDTL